MHGPNPGFVLAFVEVGGKRSGEADGRDLAALHQGDRGVREAREALRGQLGDALQRRRQRDCAPSMIVLSSAKAARGSGDRLTSPLLKESPIISIPLGIGMTAG